MTGGVDSDEGEPEKRSGRARLLLTAVLALALVATAVMVLTSSASWLRLGVLAALWAALLGAFLAANYRRQVSERDGAIAELRSVYELELEREISARRERESEIEAETRRLVREESQTDLAALRAELRALRENLERLTGGEVLVERFALRAQSTRMRTLGETPERTVVANEAISRGLLAGHRMSRDVPVARPVLGPVEPVADDPQPTVTTAGPRLQPVPSWGYQQGPAASESRRDRVAPRHDDVGRVRRSTRQETVAVYPLPHRPAQAEVPEDADAWDGFDADRFNADRFNADGVVPGGRSVRPDSSTDRPRSGGSYGASSVDAAAQTMVVRASDGSSGGRRRLNDDLDGGTVTVSRHALSGESDDENGTPESGGAHSAGRSVTDLLAELGADRPRRNRHRAT